LSAPRPSLPPERSTPAAPAPYRRGGPTELLRLAARALDFVLLVRRASRSGALPAWSTLRRSVLLELGPGPTKLRLLKRLMFGRVHFVDADPFGPEREDLTLMDLEQLRSVSSLSEVLGRGFPAPTLLFADHCLEHLSRETVDHLLGLAERQGAACLLRVPNVLSAVGRSNYEGDPTHRTPFVEEHRRALLALGLDVTPHTRWYRLGLGGRGATAGMDSAEELVITGRPARPPLHASTGDT
jgi:hypothetical protein